MHERPSTQYLTIAPCSAHRDKEVWPPRPSWPRTICSQIALYCPKNWSSLECTQGAHGQVLGSKSPSTKGSTCVSAL